MEYFDHIEDYKNGTLKGERLDLFEQELKNNNSLRAGVDNYDLAKSISKGLLEIDIKETLDQLEADELKQKKSPVRKWLLAASLVGIIGLAGFLTFNYQNKTLERDQIWASYLKPVDQEATKSIDTIGMSAFQKGKHFFALNDFESSKQSLKESIQQNTSVDQLSKAYYWLGHVYMNQSQWQKAIDAFEQSNETGVEQNLEICRALK